MIVEKDTKKSMSPPRPYLDPPFINFVAQGILLIIKIKQIKFHCAHSFNYILFTTVY